LEENKNFAYKITFEPVKNSKECVMGVGEDLNPLSK
jgi:hypothetical protein